MLLALNPHPSSLTEFPTAKSLSSPHAQTGSHGHAGQTEVFEALGAIFHV